MGATLAILAGEYEENSYTAYPMGFYKNVVLNKEKQEKIHQILIDCTGMEEGYTEAIYVPDFKNQTDDSAVIQITGVNPPVLSPAESLPYDKFLRHMKKADEIIGGGTSYDVENVKNNAMTYATYEDAKKTYDASLYTDRISRGMDPSGNSLCTGIRVLPGGTIWGAGRHFGAGSGLDRKYQRRGNKADRYGGMEPDPQV